MKILVTGASGRIGRMLVAALLEQGHDVRCLVMQQDPNAAKLTALGPGVELMRGHLEYYPEVEPAVAGVEAIYHLGQPWGASPISSSITPT